MADLTRATKNWPCLTRVKSLWPGPITSYQQKGHLVDSKNIILTKNIVEDDKVILQ